MNDIDGDFDDADEDMIKKVVASDGNLEAVKIDEARKANKKAAKKRSPELGEV